jgi:predicted DNA-binding transcriptional regulator AlpA
VVMTMVAHEERRRSRLLSPAEVAIQLGVEASTLAAWRRRGIGPRFVRLTARCVRYAESEVERFLTRRRAEEAEADQ